MLKEVVETIPSRNVTDETLKWNKKYHVNWIDFKRKRTPQYAAEEYTPMDNAQTYKIKKCLRNFKTPLTFSFFIICVMNIIVSCGVSANDVYINNDSKEMKAYEVRAPVKNKYLNGYKYEDKIYGKDLRKGQASVKKHTAGEKNSKYGTEVQEFNKYDYYRNKEDSVVNVTEFPPYLDISRFMYDDSKAIGYPHDLVTNPYYVKNINFNLRAERHQFNEKIVKLGVLLPADPQQVFSLAKVLPILEIAVPAVTKPDGPLPGWSILVDYRDTRCSSVEGPLAAFEFYVNGSAGKF